MTNARTVAGTLTRGLAFAAALTAFDAHAWPLNTLDPQNKWAEAARGGDFLFPGQRIVSYGCYYHADMQYDGNFVLYRGPGTANAIWSSRTSPNRRDTRLDPTCTQVSPCPMVCTGAPGPCCYCTAREVTLYQQLFKYVQMQSDGKVVVASASWRPGTGYFIEPIWTAGGGAGVLSGRYLTVEQAGNMIIRDNQGSWFWSTNTGGNQGPIVQPCNIPSQKTRVLAWQDLPGNDYEYTVQSTWQACANRCVQSGGLCKAFTSDLNTGGCWLKSATNLTLNYDTRFYSGEIVNGWN